MSEDQEPEAELTEPGTDLAEPTGALPDWVAGTFDWLWVAITKSKLGMGAFILIIYVIPYGLVIAAFTTQIRDAGSFIILGYAALIVSAFVAAQPAPSPAMGTASLFLAALMGANVDVISAGLLPAATQTIGLAVGYGAGASGLGPALTKRLSTREAAAKAFDRAGEVIRKRGATAMLFLASIPNPLYAYSAVFAGASKTPFGRFLTTSFIGGVGRFIVCALIGEGITRI